MSRRLRDWQSRLQACLAQRWARPFAWGTQDCVMFGADCARACTGTDPAEGMRGAYSTAAEAARLVAELGGLAAIAGRHLGPEIPPAMAQPADVGLLINDGRECLGVFTGAVWHAPGAQGLCALPREQVLRAWRLERAEG